MQLARDICALFPKNTLEDLYVVVNDIDLELAHGTESRAVAEQRNGAGGRIEGARERGSEGARERGSEGARERGSEGAWSRPRE